MAVALIALIGAVLLTVGWVVLGIRANRALARAIPRPGGQRSCPALRGEVLFATGEGGRSLGLDCMVRARDRTDGRLEPVHIRTVGALLRGMGISPLDLIPAWLAEGRRVYVEVVPEKSWRSRVRLSSKESVVTLDVEHLAGPAASGGYLRWGTGRG